MITELLRSRVAAGDRLLDVGTKHGRTVTGLPCDVYGIDIELDPQVDDVQFALADGCRLPFASDTFDYVVCTQVLEHLPDKRALVREMSRVLRPDGTLYVNFPNRLFPDRPHSPPGWYSYLPRSVALALAPALLDRETARYYERSVFNLSPIRARRLLHESFENVEYATFRHKRQHRAVFTGEKSVEGYETSPSGRIVGRAAPILELLARVPVFGWILELVYPHAEYTCREPRRS
ncbi:class I SAM-dependent methyltransferase [Halosimplex halobium]|uniref:class I SAM-dependent methyltransferase n=1 Tax=Halosimplex halobium TaxID=3396618 RepID=UPI003F55E612